jgi:hypothetical protein
MLAFPPFTMFESKTVLLETLDAADGLLFKDFEAMGRAVVAVSFG